MKVCIIGIDPGDATGVVALLANLDRCTWKLWQRGVIKCNYAHFHLYLHELHMSRPIDLIALERGYPVKLESALEVAERVGVVRLFAEENDIELRTYTPATIRKAVTGNGLSKEAVVRLTARELLGISRHPGKGNGLSAHEADAFSAAMCGLIHEYPQIDPEAIEREV